MKFLIVEDAENWRETLKHILEYKGGDVEVATNIETAKKFLDDPNQTFDEVISDGMNGGWKVIHEAATQRGFSMTLLSATTEFLDEAMELGIPFINKKSFDLHAFDERFFPSGESKEILI